MAYVLPTTITRIAKVNNPVNKNDKNKRKFTRDSLGPYWFLERPRDLTIKAYIDGEETKVNYQELINISPNKSIDIICK